VQGDVTDRHLLVQENVDTFDAFVGASKVEEYNTLGALMARQLGVPLTVVLVNQPELKHTLEALGIDLAVAPRLSTVGAMLQHVRGTAEEVALQNIGHERLLVLKVGENAGIAGRKVRAIPFPEDGILVAIVRDELVILPRGEDTLEAGDTALVFTTHPSAEALERLFT
jgi:trk system potassium uptake protein TrkA